jgi:hypothetical protein
VGVSKRTIEMVEIEQIEELRQSVRKELKKLTKEIIASLTGWEFILDALSVALLRKLV